MSNNTHTLADVKALTETDKVVETATAFVVNAYGKYQPNISFVLDKDFSGSPLKYRNDLPAREMIAGMGLDFGTGEEAVSVLFGDFWRSKAGKPHFRPKSPQAATHVLVRADWGCGRGGSRTRGSWEAPEGVAYFRRASSNGGGMGYDYFVMRVGYYLVVHDKELDGDAVVTPDFSVRARAVRASFAAFDKAAAAKAAAEAQAKADAEAVSRAAKAGFMPRLRAAKARLNALELGNPSTSYSKLELLGESYFVFGLDDKLYNDQNVRYVERNVVYWEQLAVQQLREQMARAEFQPLFEAFVPRVEGLGLTLVFGEDRVYWGQVSYGGFTYAQEGLDSFKAYLVRKEEEATKEREEAAAARRQAVDQAASGASGVSNDSLDALRKKFNG